jgi:ribonuclease P protein component
MGNFTFKKTERISSKRTIEKIFAGGNSSVAVYPLRAVYMLSEKDEVPVAVLVSVSKRRFRHAVDRNRVKRQVREAYRLNKQIVWEEMEKRDATLHIAFICIADKLCPSSQVARSMKKILHRIAEQFQIEE